jgi:hypothetical protein
MGTSQLGNGVETIHIESVRADAVKTSFAPD